MKGQLPFSQNVFIYNTKKATSTKRVNSHYGLWGLGITNSFVGFRTANDNLGWLQFKLTPRDSLGSINSLTLVDWAYQSVPGESIRAGDTGTLSSMPEPSSLSLMALGAVGIAALRRRRPQESHSSQIQS
ncbi:PEP-CTERM sorting domain-containing protein [Candidatus Nitrosoglobus terrae]|uniref:PEP-CTERM sorting domain-containing protein n=1 Tax=Candidatus Nitrosoglobus terrae TaxID=1630141 RepID=UPI000BBA876B|nr:PEP-CTERM sorting domain-containing protein [Candidatus Nitrosoglobus terrae]